MNDEAKSLMVQRGASYLSVVAVAGVLTTAFVLIAGAFDVWTGHLQAGIGKLIVGVFLGAAAVRVVRMARETRRAVRRAVGRE